MFEIIKTVLILSVGWLVCPEEYERYTRAWAIVRNNPELAKRIIYKYETQYIIPEKNE